MADAKHTPTEISLHAKSRLLVVSFDDGRKFELPCEYLRVFSPAAEVKTSTIPVIRKEQVNISNIEAQGTYAIRIYFDDDHDTGIYSWGTLYDLGVNYEANWADYLKRLEEYGHKREEAKQQRMKLRILYFANLVPVFEKAEEETLVPPAVKDVASLLKWLRMRGDKWDEHLQDDDVQVMVNKQLAQLFTKLDYMDEVGIVSTPEVGKV